MNPFGIAFHPLPLARSLHRLASETLYTAADLHFAPTPPNVKEAAAEDSSNAKEEAGLYYSLDHHTKYSHPEAAQCLSRVNADLVLGARQLRRAKFLFVTLGTSWGYSLIENDGPHEKYSKDAPDAASLAATATAETAAAVSVGLRLQGDVVANCHRRPGQQFTKHMCSPGDAAAALRSALEACRRVNPALQVVLTVSPVRHWRDGAVENSRSKASLLLAVDDLLQQQPSYYEPSSSDDAGVATRDGERAAASSDRSAVRHRGSRSETRAPPECCVSYFPSYEVVLDDLRDYRFFDQDMLHPSEVSGVQNCQ